MVTTSERRRRGRVAGAWYAGLALIGPIGLVYAPSQIRVAGDAAATASALINHATTARIGVAASLACQVIFLFLVLALERFFEGVDERMTRLVRSLVVAAVPIAIAGELLVIAALEVVSGAGAGLPSLERATIALTLLNVHETWIAVAAGLFWGLWLFPFGVLVLRSGFVPRLLGWLLLLGGSAYLVDASLALFAPALRARVTDVLLLPLAAGELSTVAWLLARGARELPHGPGHERASP